MNPAKDHAYTHNENRSKICLFCLKKRGRNGTNVIVEIKTDGKIEALVNYIFKYKASDQSLPNGICRTCLMKLYSSKKQEKKLLESPKVDFNYKTVFTRQSSQELSCNCLICELARERPGIPQQDRALKSEIISKVKSNQSKGQYMRCFFNIPSQINYIYYLFDVVDIVCSII